MTTLGFTLTATVDREVARGSLSWLATAIALRAGVGLRVFMRRHLTAVLAFEPEHDDIG